MRRLLVVSRHRKRTLCHLIDRRGNDAGQGFGRKKIAAVQLEIVVSRHYRFRGIQSGWSEVFCSLVEILIPQIEKIKTWWKEKNRNRVFLEHGSDRKCTPLFVIERGGYSCLHPFLEFWLLGCVGFLVARLLTAFSPRKAPEIWRLTTVRIPGTIILTSG